MWRRWCGRLLMSFQGGNGMTVESCHPRFKVIRFESVSTHENSSLSLDSPCRTNHPYFWTPCQQGVLEEQRMYPLSTGRKRKRLPPPNNHIPTSLVVLPVCFRFPPRFRLTVSLFLCNFISYFSYSPPGTCPLPFPILSSPLFLSLSVLLSRSFSRSVSLSLLHFFLHFPFFLFHFPSLLILSPSPSPALSLSLSFSFAFALHFRFSLSLGLSSLPFHLAIPHSSAFPRPLCFSSS